MSTQALDGLRRPGWLTFAGVVLVSVGFARIIESVGNQESGNLLPVQTRRQQQVFGLQRHVFIILA